MTNDSRALNHGELQREVFRRKVIELAAKGLGIARIAKLTGKTYAHTKKIFEQETTTRKEKS